MSILITALASIVAQPITVAPGKVLEGVRPVALAAAPIGGRFVACLEDGSVRVIDSRTRMTVRELARHPQPAYAVAWSADNTLIATGDESARIWLTLADTGVKVREYRTHTKGIQKLSFNLPKTLLISTGKDDEIKVYNIQSPRPKEVRTILGKGVNFYGATFHSRLPTVFSTGILGVGGGRAYDATTGNVRGFIVGHESQGAFDVAYNPAGTRIVTGGRDGTAIVWDASTYKRIATLRGHADWVNGVAYSPNGRLIATASTDRTVKVWDAVTYKKVADLASQSFVGSPLCFTADGRTLVTVNDQGYAQLNAVAPPQSLKLGKATPSPKKKPAPKRKAAGKKGKGG